MSDEIEVKKQNGGARPYAGAPSAYHDGMPAQMLEYFDVSPYTILVTVDDLGVERQIRMPTDFRTFEGFAAKLKVSKQSLFNWKKKHKEFRKMWRICKAMQDNYIMVNGMAGTTNSSFTRFAAVNLMRWRDKHDVTSAGKATPVAPTTFTLKIGDD